MLGATRIALTALLLGALAMVLPAGAAAKPKGGEGQGKKGPRQPNLIVIVTDDQVNHTFTREVMPRTFERVVDPGTSFSEFIVSTPLCCPSRAVMATGQYGHNNGVLKNNYGNLLDNRNVLPNWLRRAGYKTIHVGRWFNGYEGRGRQFKVSPGWNVWRTALARRAYYDYELTIGGRKGETRTKAYGSDPSDHLTGVISRIAAAQIKKSAKKRKPFYLQVDHFAPHDGLSDGGACDGLASPGPLDGDLFADEPLLLFPGINEPDMSDKPDFMASLRELGQGERAFLRLSRNCALGSLRTVDRGVEQIFKALEKSRSLRRTAVVFTSDNGYAYGEHRLLAKKQYPYDGPLRVPFAIRMPTRFKADVPATTAAPAANVDLVPTLVDLADAEPCIRDRCRTMDGRSLLGELNGQRPIPDDRRIVIDYDAPNTRGGIVCTWSGLRNPAEVFIRHSSVRYFNSGPCRDDDYFEYYDLAADPFQLDSLAPTEKDPELSGRQAVLAGDLERLLDCSGIQGRDEATPGRPFCE